MIRWKDGKVDRSFALPYGEYTSDLVDALDACVAALRKDTERLRFVSQMIDGIGEIDFHEQAAIYASARGNDEANGDDYLAVVRDAIDSALAAEGKKWPIGD